MVSILAQEGGNALGSFLGVLIIAALIFAGVKAYQASKEETSESRTINSLPPSIQHVAAQMDSGSQNAFFNEYERKKKKKSIGWIAWFLIGWHYLYVGKVGVQFAFWLTFGGFGIWWIVDFFRMPSIIRSANEQIARDAIQVLGTGAAFGRTAGQQGVPPQTPGTAAEAPSEPPAVEGGETGEPAPPSE